MLEDVSVIARQPKVASSRSVSVLNGIRVVIDLQSLLIILRCFLIELKVHFQILLHCCVFFTIACSVRRGEFLMMSTQLLILMKIKIQLQRLLFIKALAVLLQADANHCVSSLLKLIYRVLQRAD